MPRSTLRKPMRKKTTVVAIDCPPSGAIVEITKAAPAPKKRSSVAKLDLDDAPTGEFDTVIRRLINHMDVSSSATTDKRISCSGKAIHILNGMMVDLNERCCSEAVKIAVHNGDKTILDRIAIAAIKIVIGGELAAGAINSGKISAVSYDRMSKLVSTSDLSASRSQKAQLIFPISKSENMLKESTRKRVSESAGIYITAALQHICAEVLDNTIKICDEQGMKTIQPRHIKLGIENDMELNRVFRGGHFITG